MAASTAFLQPLQQVGQVPVADIAAPAANRAALPQVGAYAQSNSKSASSRVSLAAVGLAAGVTCAASASRGRKKAASKLARASVVETQTETLSAKDALFSGKASSLPKSPMQTNEINYYELDAVDASKVLESANKAVEAASIVCKSTAPAEERLIQLLASPEVMNMLISISRLPVFSNEMGLAFKENLELLRTLKQIKYFWSVPRSQFAILLQDLAQQLKPELAAPFEEFLQALTQTPDHTDMLKRLQEKLPADAKAAYLGNSAYLEHADPHAVYPTSIYRQCDALTLATEDASTIEAVMSTTLTTTIKIARDVLEPSNRLLYNVYKPLGRCVAVVDDKVDENYGKALDAYFAHHGIEFIKLVFSGNEVDKDIRDVERILVALKKTGQGRQEPVLVVGGGVIADIAGFATALYSRNTPYVMLCTSIVSGIDAGPSPRVCCNGFDYKNLYGAYHPPVLTITDRGFWKNLHPGWLRHGVAEIIKMAVMKDIKLFELMEKWGKKCNETKFGTEGESVDDPEFQDVCDLIIGKAMEGYVKSEYGNLWETHQCRPHAYGHTWSPGYELPSGMLHGQAVGTCMGFGAYLAEKEGMIDNVEMHRVLKVISDCELCLWHPVMEDSDAVWRSQVAMIEKRGGNLCAPVPMPLGESGYINELTEDMLKQRLQEYKELCMDYPRQGAGVDMHCVDVGLEDPQAKKVVAKAEDRFVVTPSDLVSVKLGNAIEKKDFRTVAEAVKIVDSVDSMVTKYSSQPSAALKNITLETAKSNPMWAEQVKEGKTSRLMEAEMISGQAEGQLLQLLIQFGKVKKVLDIGTFTGYSSLAMAEALPADGSVITLEREQEAADIAKGNWESSSHASKIESRVGEAKDMLEQLAAEGHSFDLVFLDVDKPGYFPLYQYLMESGLLRVGGLLAVDNTMYKGEELNSEKLSGNGAGAKALNEGLLADDRVQQVMLPLRDGVTLAYRTR